jgi:hypothetical protein
VKRVIWLVAFLATTAALGEADDKYFDNLLQLEARTPVPMDELEAALKKATASQRGRYEYLFFRAITAYFKNKIEAGDAFREATLAAMQSDGFDKPTIEGIQKRLSAAAEDAKHRATAQRRVVRPPSGFTEGMQP